MSVLRNNVYANDDTPLWATTGGGGGGGAVSILQDSPTAITSNSWNIASGSTQIFFSIDVPADWVGKAVLYSFSGIIDPISMASGTTYHLAPTMYCQQETYNVYAASHLYDTITSIGAEFSLTMVAVPISTNTCRVAVRNFSGVGAVGLAIICYNASATLLDPAPTITNIVSTA